jgi:hypothetical protein
MDKLFGVHKNIRHYSKHLPHYLPLLGIFTAGILAFILFSYDKNFQIGVVISVAVAHVAWGLMHHYIHKDLSLDVLVEYIAIALLGLAVLLSVVFRG